MRLYDNARTVPDENQILIDFQQRSQRCYQEFMHFSDLKYGEHPRSTLDLFPCKSDKTVIFIHGGYWQWCEKSDFAFIAEDVLKQNVQCVLLEYDLAPHSHLQQISDQIKQALDFIALQEWATSEAILVGHSAGAHLAALHLSHPLVSSAVLMSGIYDLAPIQTTHLNQALSLSHSEIQHLSPAYSDQAVRKPYSILYGSHELDELRWQSQNYFEHRVGIDHSLVSLRECKGINHYNILDYFFKQLFSLNFITTAK